MLHPEMMAMEARMRHADLQREAEQLRLAREIGKQTAGAYRERRAKVPTPPLALLVAQVRARLTGNYVKARKQATA